MDIYLLREGKEFGPYSEEATQEFLKRGTLVMDDLAWTPGLPAWSPLGQVLYPKTQTIVEEVTLKETMIEEVQIAEVQVPAHGDLATAKQKAFLSYMGIPFTSDTTKEHAAVLVNEVMEDPAQIARVHHWNEDRLRLHPDIFAAEIQAKKEDRPNRFFEACQHEGADRLEGITKAHCQVLIGFLDVNYPNWDANEADAARNYFFPAVAEKFPELVRKEWRGKLHYPSGPKSAAANKVRRNPSGRVHSGRSPLGAVIRGLIYGLELLLALYIVVQFYARDPVVAEATPAEAKTEPVSPATAPQAAIEPAAEIAAPSAVEPPEPPAPAEPKTRITITKPVDVSLRFGTARLAAGTEFKIIAQDDTHVTVNYLAQTVKIPIEFTDLAPPQPGQ